MKLVFVRLRPLQTEIYPFTLEKVINVIAPALLALERQLTSAFPALHFSS